MWFLFALLSAVFAALTSILAKIGIENVDSNLATAVRTTVVLVLAWGIVLLTGKVGGLADIGPLDTKLNVGYTTDLPAYEAALVLARKLGQL